MPIYEYECPKCKKRVEMILNREHIAPLCCNEDCNVEMHKVFSASNFSLKGSGWAKDGYSSKK